jgi:hypothetical protein
MLKLTDDVGLAAWFGIVSDVLEGKSSEVFLEMGS